MKKGRELEELDFDSYFDYTFTFGARKNRINNRKRMRKKKT